MDKKVTSNRTIRFYKYSATGNDFIALDNRDNLYDQNDSKLWQKLCSRRTGIGADGVLLLENSNESDFKMAYINSDGSIGEMCGNGARTIVAFARSLGVTPTCENYYVFSTACGVYSGEYLADKHYKVEMTELYDIDTIDVGDLVNGEGLYLNTGVPHAVFRVENLKNYDVVNTGRTIRNDSRFERGTNVNFFEVLGVDHIALRTYERGVEDETLACGTGATAAAVTCQRLLGMGSVIIVEMPGGTLTISEINGKRFLSGAVDKVFEGTIEV